MKMLILVFVCLCAGALGKSMLTYYDQSKKTWADAQAYCREHHTDLPTIHEMTEDVLITRDSWLGAYRTSAKAPWKWSAGDVPLTLDALWEVFQTSEQDSDENCVYKQADVWRSKSCSEEHSFFCVDEPIFLVRERKTWEEALEHCRSTEKKNVSISYELAFLPTVEEQKAAQALIQAVGRYQVWVGLRFLGARWMWITGEDVQDGNIESCPLNKRCGTLRVNMTEQLNTKKCHTTTFFLCSIVPNLSTNHEQ